MKVTNILLTTLAALSLTGCSRVSAEAGEQRVLIEKPWFFGHGGIATNVLADHAARLAPLTTTDADTLISAVRAAPLLRGYRGTRPADLDALRVLLLRVSRLAEDLPEITELDLNPVIARPDGAHIVDARIKVMPYEPQDPFLRKLR